MADKCCVTSDVHMLNCVLAKTAVGVGGWPVPVPVPLVDAEEEEVDVAVDASASFQMVDNSCTVCFMALGYCSVTTTGTLSAVAEASTRPARRAAKGGSAARAPGCGYAGRGGSEAAAGVAGCGGGG